ncbi:aminoglycoside phosphotransferase family protein [Salinicola rhizosphaerae]|uniref:Aminoglycoside phosphotransferase n=1 Tax=Salinicola rhizosphaerae TaxID=1443141 RepID=A0ABQ3DU34_9GAMM|nr:phosphotransferase [Salinicola rhizosphaerae]GHB16551.1 aminoglycoside phosphotransferase [Salinicola rhizosphaerae]
MTLRLDTLRDWIATQHDLDPDTCRFDPIAGDASLRGYCRVTFPAGAVSGATSRIVMDAPPALEESEPFVRIGRQWQAAGLQVPTIHAVDLAQGFLELDDLGDDSLHHHFGTKDEARRGTAQALAVLDEIQRLAPHDDLPPYSPAFLEEEMDRFPDWGLARWLKIETPGDWPTIKRHLLDNIAMLPTVAVHRDFDAMNLMVHRDRLWIIDFQGALAGPLGYDLISLLRGRYHRWPREEMDRWIDAFRRRSIDSGVLNERMTEHDFRQAVESIGAQRQLKILGQFCRLYLRDGKPRYLDWLPHFLRHLDEGLEALPALVDFRHWLRDSYRPAMEARLAEHHAGRDQECSS